MYLLVYFSTSNFHRKFFYLSSSLQASSPFTKTLTAYKIYAISEEGPLSKSTWARRYVCCSTDCISLGECASTVLGTVKKGCLLVVVV